MRKILAPVLALALAALGLAQAQGMSMTETVKVTITNTTSQPVSPPLLVSHDGSYAPFYVGEAASPELTLLAEDGAAARLAEVAGIASGVYGVVVADGGLAPGASVTLEIAAGEGAVLTLITMLVTTNDAIVVWSAYAHDGMMAMDAMAPMSDGMMAKQGVKHDGVVRVYDAGTEANTELCAHIPGPPCGNKGARVTDGAEGFVGPHGGILGVGDLDPQMVGWLHPVLEVSVER
jgi:hypothetical protein